MMRIEIVRCGWYFRSCYIHAKTKMSPVQTHKESSMHLTDKKPRQVTMMMMMMRKSQSR